MKLANKKILVTGAAGFLGTHLAEACHLEGGRIYGIDIRKPFDERIWAGFSEQGLISDTSESLLIENNFDFIFHLAGGASVGLSVQDPLVDFNNLLPPTLTFLTWINKHCPNTHFVLFSSAAVYGNPDVLPIKESAQSHPLSPYGIHKLLAEDMLFHYSKYYNVKISVLRIFSAFGEGLRKQIFWDVMSRYRNALAGNKGKKVTLELFGTGLESRDFIHGKDVARAAILIGLSTLNKQLFNVFNVASGEETTIKDAMGYLFSNASIVPEVIFSGVNRAGDPETWRADISKLKKIGFENKLPLHHYLNSLYTWCMEQ